MPLDQMTRAVSPQMRGAAAFVHWLRSATRHSGPHYDEVCGSPQLRDAWRSSDTRDAGRFAEIVERVSGRTIQWCDHCGDPVWSASFYGAVDDGNEICRNCLENYYWCDHCDGYYGEPHEHGSQGSQCEAPRQSFAFPLADGGTLRNDVTLAVETPAGLISEAGMVEIRYMLHPALGWWFNPGEIAHEWQTKDGNFTKRLAKLALQDGYKIPAPLLSAIGNIARAHSSSGHSHSVQLTRDLNLPAREFVHDGSCWWSSEWKSRCALKQEGGFAIRTFDGGDYPVGRAWAMPFDVERHGSGYRVDLMDDPMGADAFVVFNAYGPDGYEFARIVAQMRGWTYRKIGFLCDPMYVNSGGFLVAPAEVCAHVSDLCFEIDLGCGCE